MKTIILAAAAALAATPVLAQEAPVTPDQLVLPGATLAPDCGNLYGLAGKAFCVSAPLSGIGALADAYVADLQTKGWLPAGGDDNRVVFVRRRDSGGCDGLQMQAFYDTSKPTDDPAALAYLGFGPIPGDVCATHGPVAGPPLPRQQ